MAKPAWSLQHKREEIIEWYDDSAVLEGPTGTVYVTAYNAQELAKLSGMVHSILNQGPAYLELYGELTRAIADGTMAKLMALAADSDPATAARLQALTRATAAIADARAASLEGN